VRRSRPRSRTSVRIVDMVGLDQEADGGRHVASSRQVGRASRWSWSRARATAFAVCASGSPIKTPV
jgi:Ser-tRNA(Ala) deacylase AlaX